MIARLGRACFRHGWWVLLGWLVVIVAGVLASGPVFQVASNDHNPKQLESTDALDRLRTASGSDGDVLGMVDRIDPMAPGVREAVDRAVRDLADRPDVSRVTSPYAPDTAGVSEPALVPALRSQDGQAVLVVVALTRLELVQRNTAVDGISQRLHQLADELHDAGQSQARVRVGGDPAVTTQVNQATQDDLGMAEIVSLPITLIVLIIVFRGLFAAALPVLAALVAVTSAMILLLGYSLVAMLDTNVVTVVTLMGLGLSIDYGLLLVSRYREELAGGLAPEQAIGQAWATAGRTVLFSGLTVAAALSGLLMFDLPGLSSLGAAGISIAMVAALTALTFTAALVGVAQRWIKVGKSQPTGSARSAEAGFFARLSLLVQRRPAIVAAATTALLLAAGAPLLTTTIKLTGLAQVPTSIESRQVADELTAQFGMAATPAVTVVARTDDPAGLQAWATRWTTDPVVLRVTPVKAAGDGIASVQIDVRGDSQSQQAQDLVNRIRADRPPGGESWVTGEAAILYDIMQLIQRGLPAAVGMTLLAMVLLLFAMTGSLVIPIKAVLANVVSLGAAFGVMNAVFERGWLAGPLHTLTAGGLDPFVVLIVFAFSFGLSMDYEVFLLSRIKEYVDKGIDTQTAVRLGLQHTGRTITSAALLMMIVFGAFIGARMGSIEEIGLGLTVAVLVDATIVRCLLVPATMTLLGRYNWWAPAPLKRLHRRIDLSERPPPSPAPEPVAAQVKSG